MHMIFDPVILKVQQTRQTLSIHLIFVIPISLEGYIYPYSTIHVTDSDFKLRFKIYFYSILAYVCVSVLNKKSIYLSIYLFITIVVLLVFSTDWLTSAPPSNRGLRLGVVEEDALLT
jgi:hypothetical protein